MSRGKKNNLVKWVIWDGDFIVRDGVATELLGMCASWHFLSSSASGSRSSFKLSNLKGCQLCRLSGPPPPRKEKKSLCKPKATCIKERSFNNEGIERTHEDRVGCQSLASVDGISAPRGPDSPSPESTRPQITIYMFIGKEKKGLLAMSHAFHSKSIQSKKTGFFFCLMKDSFQM
eukprot:1139587-Pelagomonas_calceolata.AAC.1